MKLTLCVRSFTSNFQDLTSFIDSTFPDMKRKHSQDRRSISSSDSENSCVDSGERCNNYPYNTY